MSNGGTLAGVLPAPDELTCRRLLALLSKAQPEENKVTTKTDARFPAGPRLRAARKAAGISAEQVAIDLAKTYFTVNGYERGIIEPPVHVLVKMCQMYGVGIDEVLGD